MPLMDYFTTHVFAFFITHLKRCVCVLVVFPPFPFVVVIQQFALFRTRFVLLALVSFRFAI